MYYKQLKCKVAQPKCENGTDLIVCTFSSHCHKFEMKNRFLQRNISGTQKGQYLFCFPKNDLFKGYLCSTALPLS